MATFRLLTPDEQYIFKKLRMAWWYGVDAIEIADGNFVFPDRVYLDIINLIDEGKATEIFGDRLTEYQLEGYKLKIKYLDGDDDEQEFEIEWDNKNQFPEIEDPEFIEYDNEGNRIN